jgi:hypothetical protein
MRVYMIKHKGATQWYNFFVDRVFTFTYPKEEKVNVGSFFFRKRDAVKYLNSFPHAHFYEVVGATVDFSKWDNRFSNRKKVR